MAVEVKTNGAAAAVLDDVRLDDFVDRARRAAEAFRQLDQEAVDRIARAPASPSRRPLGACPAGGRRHRANVIAQKSLAEGFGLTVTEEFTLQTTRPCNAARPRAIVRSNSAACSASAPPLAARAGAGRRGRA